MSILSVFTTKEDVDEVLAKLQKAGFSDEKIAVGHGQAHLDQIDLDGSRHGVVTKFVRQYQRSAGAEAYMIRQSEVALKHGEYTILVRTDGSEEQQVAVQDVMISHTEKSIFYCGRFTITILQLGKNYYNPEANYEDKK